MDLNVLRRARRASSRKVAPANILPDFGVNFERRAPYEVEGALRPSAGYPDRTSQNPPALPPFPAARRLRLRTMRRPTPLLVPTCIALAALAGAGAPSIATSYEQEIRPILEKTCFHCHGDKEPEAGLDLTRIKTEADALAAPEVWDKVNPRVYKYEMPPQGSFPDLSSVDRARIIAWIEANRRPTGDCTTLATDLTVPWYTGTVMSRRLTRAEYNNSIRDLVGLDLKPADAFPADGSGGEGFDNVGATQFLSPILLERYLAAATGVLDVVFPSSADAGKSSAPRPQSPAAAAARKRILVAAPGVDRSPRDAARVVLREFAARAFRRPVADDEVERLLGLFDRGQSRGDTFESSVKLALEGVLISPHFLFLSEPEPNKEGVYRLDQFQLAARLAYFLWASLPDEQLTRLATSGELYNDEVLRQQVRRMLADPKAHGLAESFATQWLGIGALGDAVRPDSQRFPQFDDRLVADMKAEAVALVEAVFRENRSLLDLVDCNYANVNARLAAHYGLPPVEGDHLRRVTLDDRRRGGVLGLGAVLTATSYPLRTSPVIRGKWVLETLLGSTVPMPPPNVGKLPDDDRAPAARGLTFREQLEAHRTKPECAACHDRMDPLGFGLENFDAVGRWRHHQNGMAVDSSGKLPSGEAFAGVGELKEMLLGHKDEFLTTMSRKMLGYALGRGLTNFDDCVVKHSLEALAADDNRAAALFETIVLSYPFQHRYARK
jgi:hypothetical protein